MLNERRRDSHDSFVCNVLGKRQDSEEEQRQQDGTFVVA